VEEIPPGRTWPLPIGARDTGCLQIQRPPGHPAPL
jgi:hypothetical protein